MSGHTSCRGVAALSVVVAVSLVFLAVAVGAQPAVKVARVGVLIAGPHGTIPPPFHAFRQALQDLGYVEGRTIALEYRFAEGRLDRFADLAAELVRVKVDLIVAPGTAAAQAARKATVSIVIVAAGNPVGDGLIATFRPTRRQRDRPHVPTVSRVAVLWNPLTAPHRVMIKESEPAARALGLALQPVSARTGS